MNVTVGAVVSAHDSETLREAVPVVSSPAEAVHAATYAGARALLRDDVGRLTVGARADLVLLDAPSHVHLAYRPGVPLVAGTWQGGRPLR